MSIEEIKAEIVKILQEKIQCDTEQPGANMDVPLTGKPFGLSEVEMVYLLFEIEKKFRIRVEDRVLFQYGFSTIDKIVDVVNGKLN